MGYDECKYFVYWPDGGKCELISNKVISANCDICGPCPHFVPKPKKIKKKFVGAWAVYYKFSKEFVSVSFQKPKNLSDTHMAVRLTGEFEVEE